MVVKIRKWFVCEGLAWHPFFVRLLVLDPQMRKCVMIFISRTSSSDCQEEEKPRPKKRNLYEAPTPARRLDSVGSEMGVAQSIDINRQAAIYEKIREARYYIHNVVNLEEKYDEVRDACKNQHESCAFWATLGEVSNYNC